MKALILVTLIYSGIFAQTQTDIPWPTLADSPWPMIKHDPQLTGRSPYKGPQTPTVIWTVDIPHGIFSGPVIGEDKNLYFGPYYADLYFPPSGISAYFYCYDNKGNFVWEYNLPDKRPPQSGALIDSAGCIYFGSLDHHFYALNPDGTLKWRYLTGDLIGEIAIPNIDLLGNLYVSSQDGYLYSFSREGQLNWKVNHHNFTNQNTAISPDGNTLYIPGYGSNLYALNLDGSLRWMFSCGHIYYPPLVDSDGNIYFIPESSPPAFYSLQEDGSVRWKTLFRSYGDVALFSIPTIDSEGNLYTIAIDSLSPPYRALVSFNYNGDFRWNYILDDFPPNGSVEDVWQPLICDKEGTIYFGSTFGYSYYAIANNGTLKWKLPLEFDHKQVDNTGAITGDGTLYIGVHGNALATGFTKTLYAIKDTGSVGVGDTRNTITSYSLEQNYPNPLNPTTTIDYSIPEQEFVRLSVYNILGEEVAKLVEEIKSAGSYSVSFDASALPGGVYVYRLQAGGYSSARKMILLR